ncbi:acetyl esterase/lipase [Mariniflexile fucanivorans]|uniref:Acetyl esterase/lipase n=1 Tax=Mariniflexile fucanivorans TaxID=264023 RepID=A0A4R1REI2_9FLAO|nr:alpha/beta hydrolase [Mariniflexile fucanivorans]TCL64311.1 acetyl esterase/lipase [Mariniflexile fucanivorans]
MKYCMFIMAFFSYIQLLFPQEKDYTSVEYPEDYISKINVLYTQEDNWKGYMDIFINPNATNPTPVVINIHGGGWKNGQKESQTGLETFFSRGYAVANVSYRLVDVAPAPAAIQDVRCALLYIYKNAKSLNIDPSKIILLGGSAGGHLALMAGLLGDNNSFDSNCPNSEHIKVAAIIDKYGVTDLTPLAYRNSPRDWLGLNNTDAEFVKKVSPINYVSKNSPPIFIAHGDADPIVPYKQSVILYKRLKAHKVKTRLLTLKKGKHGNFTKKQNILLSKSIWKFLNNLGL